MSALSSPERVFYDNGGVKPDTKLKNSILLPSCSQEALITLRRRVPADILNEAVVRAQIHRQRFAAVRAYRQKLRRTRAYFSARLTFSVSCPHFQRSHCSRAPSTGASRNLPEYKNRRSLSKPASSEAVIHIRGYHEIVLVLLQAQAGRNKASPGIST